MQSADAETAVSIHTDKITDRGDKIHKISFTDGLLISRIEGHVWCVEEKMPWQPLHCHDDVAEVYTIEQGWCWILYITHDEFVECGLSVCGDSFSIPRSVPHACVVGPGARVLRMRVVSPGREVSFDSHTHIVDDDLRQRFKKARRNAEFIIRGRSFVGSI